MRKWNSNRDEMYRDRDKNDRGLVHPYSWYPILDRDNPVPQDIRPVQSICHRGPFKAQGAQGNPSYCVRCTSTSSRTHSTGPSSGLPRNSVFPRTPPILRLLRRSRRRLSAPPAAAGPAAAAGVSRRRRRAIGRRPPRPLLSCSVLWRTRTKTPCSAFLLRLAHSLC